MELYWILVAAGVLYVLWATYMKTYRTDTWLQLQEAGDHRRARILRAVAHGAAEVWQAAISRFKTNR